MTYLRYMDIPVGSVPIWTYLYDIPTVYGHTCMTYLRYMDIPVGAVPI